MLKISNHDLKQEAKIKGYRPEMIEKVYHLLDLLEEFMAIPYLSDRIVLKGGTAINLFCTDQFPRLSVDLDFNYIGSVDKEVMKNEKLQLETIMLDICNKRQYEVHRNPKSHAGGNRTGLSKCNGYKRSFRNRSQLFISGSFMENRVALFTRMAKSNKS